MSPGHRIRQTCGNRACCRPEHLELRAPGQRAQVHGFPLVVEAMVRARRAEYIGHPADAPV
jgi:hypothetical protein